MTPPRRYRIALRAYPGRYRKGRGDELLSTLADGDDERGRPSTREAVALGYRGLLQRGRIATSSDGLLVIAASLVLVTQAGPQPIDGHEPVTGREAVNTLGAALFVTGASILLALAASARRASNQY